MIHFVFTKLVETGSIYDLGVHATGTACGATKWEVGSESTDDVSCEGCLAYLAGLNASLGG